MPKVYSRRKGSEPAPPGAVYIGRGTPWGNPHKLNDPNNNIERLTVVGKYAADIAQNPDFIARIKRELRGKDLVCWCAPLPCHGDLLLEIANVDD